MTAMLDDEAADPDLTNAELRLRLSEALSERDEAKAQTAALAEVLEVINSSPGDLTPVFDAMLEKATRLCDAAFGFLWTWDGEQMHRLAFRGLSDEFMEEFRQPLKPPPGSIPERIITGERVVFDVDVLEGPRRSPTLAGLGARSCVGVALRKDYKLLGGITMYRREVRPFAQKQLVLLESFAAQAVIAMENARLITETREALEHQTATAEVLGVINTSPGDLTPVWDGILERALHLCEAALGTLGIYDGECFRWIAGRGLPASMQPYLDEPVRPLPGMALYRIMQGEAVVHLSDISADPTYRTTNPNRRLFVDLAQARTTVWLALRKDNTLLGVISVYRQEVHPFTDKQIALLQNFAAQAVIAMENARLITETREALEQQTATAEVLGVINSSPGDLAPVFDAILEKAHSLCGAAYGSLHVIEGDGFRATAVRGMPDEFAEIVRRPTRLGPNHPSSRLAGGEAFVQILDAAEVNDQRLQEAVCLAGMHTVLFVPLRKDETFLGYIVASRLEIRPFSDKEIALLQNFAAQAVIAMENARLITETREALEQQTATAEILRVISSSPTDVQPTFDAIAESANRLCGAASGGVFRFDGSLIHLAAHHGWTPAELAAIQRAFPLPPGDDSVTTRSISTRSVVHLADLAANAEHVHPSVVQSGLRTVVSVPMLLEGNPVGAINVTRREVAPFSERQIELLKMFADQAVIAIENARLFNELRERTGDLQESLEYQTATSDVLKLISRSTFDLQPVLQSLVETAVRLCGADFGHLDLPHDGVFRPTATLAFSDEFDAVLQSTAFVPDRGSTVGRVLLEKRIVHVADVTSDSEYTFSDAVDLGNVHAVLGVPLLRGSEIIGVFALGRERPGAFSDRQLDLVQTFADQAVIAIENARLISETREALEQQTATAEVLQVINSSPGDIIPVFNAMLEKAVRLCEAANGVLFTQDGDRFRAVALRDVPEKHAEFLQREPLRLGPDTFVGRVMLERRPLHVADLTTEEPYLQRIPIAISAVEVGGTRTMLTVPLMKDDAFLGIFQLSRQEVRPFSDKQITLVQNFAAQAVIAMENARLITETREALEQQTATADILRIISGSATDVQPVFEAIVERAIKLCEAEFAGVARFDEDGLLRLAATSNLSLEEAASFHSLFPRPANRGFVMGRAFLDCRPVNVEDVLTDPEYDQRTQARRLSASNYRSFLGVPMLRDGKAIGVIGCARRRVKAFTTADIEVLSTFADQAVIAIENARLLGELRDRQAELRVTFDNMGDAVVMFDGNLRLAAWNRNFQALLDLPDEVLAERPTYSDYLRILADRGEFGTVDIQAEINRRLENTNEEFRQERTRPDGRVIEVRRNAVPDGGFVLIYSDITERKRSEAEIRAARDAAEAAYRDLKAAQANLVQAEKMASLGQLTAGIAHEIKNPLNFVNNFAGLSVELLDELKETAAPALTALPEDERAEVNETIEMLTSNLEKIAEHGRRADGIVKSMLDHSRGGTGERRSVDLNSLIDEALNLAYHGGRAQDQSFNITLERDFDQGIAPIELVPQDITRVCLNLFGNGFYAATKRLREGGDPKFKPILKVSTRDLGDAIEIRARDNGVGIPAEIKDKLFQPFFTTKPTGEGTGLGLSISYDIVSQQHGGTIEVDSRVGQFTEFTVRLPRTTTGRPAA